MKPYRAWKGALELTINGVPLDVKVELYSRVKKQRNKSFTNLSADSRQPVETKSFDPVSGEECKVVKGWQVKPGEFAVMTEEALEQIKAGTKTTVAKPERFVPVDQIAFDLAIDRFAVRAQEGADKALNIVWNGLKARKLAWQSQVSLTGSNDAVLTIYADASGLWAALFPFEPELYPVPTHTFTSDTKAQALFGQMIDDEYADLIGDFDLAAFESEYAPRRQAAIDAVVDGQEVVVERPVSVDEDDAPDLMAALEASVADAKKQSPKGAKKARAKAAA